MTKNIKLTWAVLVLGAAGVIAACSDSDKAAPSKNIKVDGGESSTGTGGNSSTGGTNGLGGETASGGTTETTGTAGSTATGSGGATVGTAGAAAVAGTTGVAGSSGDCVGVANNGDPTKKCYKCTPTTSMQVLTACTDVTCIPFDNSKLTKMVNGALPALP